METVFSSFNLLSIIDKFPMLDGLTNLGEHWSSGKSLHWCCLCESQKEKRNCQWVHLYQGSSTGGNGVQESMSLYLPSYLQNCMTVTFLPTKFFHVCFCYSIKIIIIFKWHKPIFALSLTETSAFYWKLYVYFRTWNHIVVVSGKYCISCDINVYVFTWWI